jgi:23S rRNA (pseudouridine1915-N3)-methyltransferase
MYKVTIITIGRTKEIWLKEALFEYEKRLNPYIKLEWIIEKESISPLQFPYIALDAQGISYTTETLCRFLEHAFIRCKSHLFFIIGGPDGLDVSIKTGAIQCISLSPLTFTHQLTRLILIEQLYRFIQIQERKPYHK